MNCNVVLKNAKKNGGVPGVYIYIYIYKKKLKKEQK